MIETNTVGVIVIGGHVQGLGIIRVFGENGIPCLLLDDTKINLARHSKYCQSFLHYKSNSLVEFLNNLMDYPKYKDWLLIPTNDSHVKILSQNREKLNTFFNCSVAEWNIIEKSYNKIHTYKLAQKLGIPIPTTWFVESYNDLDHANISFPCIIKPAVMHSFYKHFKTKVFVCNNAEELKQNYRRALTFISPEEIIIQDIIRGSGENQYSACFLFDSEEAIVQMAARRLRQHPIDFGNATTFAETVKGEEIINLAVTLLKEMGFKGICEVEFKFDLQDQTYKLLEVNPRSWKWHYIAQVAGSPFLMSLYHYILKDQKLPKSTKWNDAYWQHRLTDRFIRWKMRIKNIKIEPENKNYKKIYAVYDKQDIRPYIFEKLYLPYLLFSR